MSGPPAHLPPPANPAVLPVLAAVTYLAALIALWGVMSLLLDREVVDYPDAGPLLGPAMAAVACAAVWTSLRGIRRRRTPWVPAIVSAAEAFAAMVIIGAIGYSITRNDPAWLVLAVAHFVTSPFVLGGALLAAVFAVGTWAITPRTS